MSKKIVNVSDFYTNVCEAKRVFSEIVEEDNKASIFAKGIKNLCDLFAEHAYLEVGKLESFLVENYKDDFFAYEWQKSITISDDVKKVSRFLNHIKGIPVAGNTAYNVELGDVILRGRVSLIMDDNGVYTAYIIKVGKANKSPAGKSVHTCTKTDLSVLCAKAALEKSYKGIKVALVYLTNDADSFGSVGDFVVANTKKSNIFVNDFAEYTEGGRLSVAALMDKITRVYSEKPKPDCYNCYKKDLCSTSTVKNMKVAKALVAEPESGYKVPSFTKVQKQVIDHVNGAMLVCAGPGSGKTATLIGRGVNLIQNHGIDPDFVLAITFTNKAAGELKERFKAALGTDTPKCCTIHSLALEILMQNKSIVGEINILSSYEKMKIVEELAENLDSPLRGFSYGSGREGRVAFLKTLGNRFDAYGADNQLFCEKNPGIDERFFSLYKDYVKIVKARGFLTFDDAIKTCVSLLNSNADILKKYQLMYKYIMVDEFQDVDGMQAEFIYCLAEHGNIVVVGDDDQSIYGFRGGSNKYMLGFKNVFENAKVVVLDKNFRSDDKIVKAAEKLISGNKQRISKKVEAVNKSDDKTRSIVEVEGQDSATLEKCVKTLLKSYSYDDIAVLSTRNDTIETLAGEVNFPVTLGKAFLIKNPVFLIALDLLVLIKEGIGKGQERLAHYLMMMGVTSDELKSFKSGNDKICIDAIRSCVLSKEAQNALSLYDRMEAAVNGDCSAFFYIDELISFFSLEDSSIASAFDEMLEGKHLRHLDQLMYSMQQMVDSSDETKLTPDSTGTVLFLTSHEAKGMEFPCVIIIDDFKTDGTEETTRLFYVAMTRPKEKLIVLKKPGEKSLIDKAV